MQDKDAYKILIVDDERNNINALSYILRPKYNVLAAKDGLSALEIAHKLLPDLILLDIVMPGMSGYEVLIHLKESEITRDIPVIFLTGLDDREAEEKGFTLGAVDYITKPFYDSIIKLRVNTQIKIIEQMRIIEQLGMIDSLTNLPNRRAFDHQLSVEWNRAVREGTALSVLMIDVDFFKEFNDKHGHLYGDEALKVIAGVIHDTLKRAIDFAARWGGEEFSVLLPGTGLKGALLVAEMLRVNVENAVIPVANDENTGTTVSVGVCSCQPQISDSAGDILKSADDALYKAKESGRNNVKYSDYK